MGAPVELHDETAVLGRGLDRGRQYLISESSKLLQVHALVNANLVWHDFLVAQSS
jgi:hypothetical protein